MDSNEFLKKMIEEKGKEFNESVDRTERVVEIISRRLQSLKESEYLEDEIAIGSCAALRDLIHEIKEKERRESLTKLLIQIIEM